MKMGKINYRLWVRRTFLIILDIVCIAFGVLSLK